jgi:starch synthase
MYIVQIASECAPVIKAGGLGDVVYGLSTELSKQGHTVELILPMYDCMRYDHIWGLHDAYRDLYVPWNGGRIHCSVYCGWVHSRLCFFIQPHCDENFFGRGTYYGCNDDVMRFAFFSKAALEFLLQSNKRPDVIHCHDWQTGLIPVLLYEMYQYNGMENQRICYTIHNFKHQGIAGPEILSATGLNRHDYYYQYSQLRHNSDPTCINLMKGGIVYANYVNTVSPHHAWEARHTSVGYGLGPTLEEHQGKFGGILNGIDRTFWDPATDTYLPTAYSADDLSGKAKAKALVRKRFNLQDDPEKPLVVFIGRLDDQKGVHLVHHSIYYTLHKGGQFVLLGSATEPGIDAYFRHEQEHLSASPDCHLELGFNEELSHLLYAAADIIVVPSNFEPCGLTQVISLAYGTVPVVRGVGGLVNTVFDWDYDTSHDPSERNGFVFYESDPNGLESALGRAFDLWYQNPDLFQKLAQQGAKSDYSWDRSATTYAGVYDHIRVG